MRLASALQYQELTMLHFTRQKNGIRNCLSLVVAEIQGLARMSF